MTHEDLADLIWWGVAVDALATLLIIALAVLVSQRGYRRRARLETAEIKQQVHDESGRVRDEAHGAHLGALRAAQGMDMARSPVCPFVYVQQTLRPVRTHYFARVDILLPCPLNFLGN